MNATFAAAAVQAPTVLLPKSGTDLGAWAVIACDQYTSQPQYWKRVAERVGDKPSTLHLTLPEVWLEEDDVEQRITRVRETMRRYVNEHVVEPCAPGFVLVERDTPHGGRRTGLLVALDLEQYDYSAGTSSLIRPTEGTIVDRLPPRVRIRRDAPLELPHILVLIDDPDRTVIEPLLNENLTPLYDFDLMMDGGHVRGRLVDSPALQKQIGERLAALAGRERFESRYDAQGRPPLLYAMGDGNHSFATAKAVWDELKQQPDIDRETHPARYAMVELVNIHDTGLPFEPIHRVLFVPDAADALEQLRRRLEQKNGRVEIAARRPENEGSDPLQAVPFEHSGGQGALIIHDAHLVLPVATLQEALDGLLAEQQDWRIDYVHGSDTVTELAREPGRLGLKLPPIDKHGFFRSIVHDGALPRKTFSLGEADDKRFYLESRLIRPRLVNPQE